MSISICYVQYMNRQSNTSPVMLHLTHSLIEEFGWELESSSVANPRNMATD